MSESWVLRGRDCVRTHQAVSIFIIVNVRWSGWVGRSRDFHSGWFRLMSPLRSVLQDFIVFIFLPLSFCLPA